MGAARGLITSYVLVFFRVAPRRVYVAGIMPYPDGLWMEQRARSLTLAEVGFLSGCRYLLYDRDAKFTAALDQVLRSRGVEPVVLPPRSPNLNAHMERWIRSPAICQPPAGNAKTVATCCRDCV